MIKFAGNAICILIIICLLKFIIVTLIEGYNHEDNNNYSTTRYTQSPTPIWKLSNIELSTDDETKEQIQLQKKENKKIKLPTLTEGPELYAVESELQTEEGEEDGELELMGYGDEEIEVEMQDLHSGEEVNEECREEN